MQAESGDAAAQPGEPPSSDPEGGSSGGGGTVPTLPFDRRAAELQRPAAGKPSECSESANTSNVMSPCG